MARPTPRCESCDAEAVPASTPQPAGGVIVGAAIVRDGQVLAARRSAPASMAGGWEFAGGKVEAGESDEQALVRECQEELGVTVRLERRVGEDVVLPTGWALRVWVAEIQTSPGSHSEPQPLQDHDVLRWLPADRLADVAWLPADWPIVHALADLLVEPEPLVGGRVGGAVRVGDTVRRPIGPWTPAVHDLLRHCRAAGVPGVPEPLGEDPSGREVLRYVPGSTMGDADPVPARFRSPSVLRSIGAWLRDLHEATASFPAEDRVWRRGRLSRSAGAVICHHDISPHNIVLDDVDGIAAVLDWDMAAPGHRLDDVAFAAWQFVLRHGLTVAEEAAGLRTLADSYGVDPRTALARVEPRLRGALRFMRRGAAAGDPGLSRLLTTGVPESVEAGLDDLDRRQQELDALLL